MANERVPEEVTALISEIVRGQKHTAAYLNRISKSLAEQKKQEEHDLKAFSDASETLKTFNDTLSEVNKQFDVMNMAMDTINTHFEAQTKMGLLVDDVKVAQNSTSGLYIQIRDDTEKQKILFDECIQESITGTDNLLQKQQQLDESFNKICEMMEKEKQTTEAAIISLKEAVDAVPVALKNLYGKRK